MRQKSFIPPKLATRLLSRILRDDLLEEVLGDLEEKFHTVARVKSISRARLNYWYQVVHYLRPFAIKKSKNRPLKTVTMYSNYFKTGYRNLLRNKGYSLINISGLAVGMAIAILIGLWIYEELTFDHYHQNHSRVAQVMQNQTVNGGIFTGQALPIPLEEEIVNNYGDDFKYIAMADWTRDHILSHGDKKHVFSGSYVGMNLPKILSLKMIYGSQDGLKEHGSILLAQSTASSLFGGQNPVGELMKIDNNLSVIVAGVYEDLPYNTTLHDLEFMAPWKLYVASEQWVQNAKIHQRWDDNSFRMFVQLEDFADLQKVSNKIVNAKYDNVPESQKQFHAQLFLHPMDDWHLRGKFKNGESAGGLIQYVRMFGAIGLFVLILACINFMNLSTARSEKRAKEVGIRKSIGSVKWQLIHQFLSESFLVVILAFTLSLILVAIALPFFNDTANKQIVFPWDNITFWLGCGVFILITGFTAGSYPAFYLSSFHPVRVLKGTFKADKNASAFRKMLVIIQFSVSVTLIIGTLIVRQQIQYSMNRPLGYDPGNLIMLNMNSPEFEGKYNLLRQELKESGAVLEIAESSGPLTGIWSNSGGFTWDGKDPNYHPDFAIVKVTHDFGKTVNWELTQGRDFSREFSDSLSFIINETAARRMGFENPVGQTVRLSNREDGPSFKIIGVVKDMLMDSPFRPVKECIYLMSYVGHSWIELKLNPEKSTREALLTSEDVFNRLLPNVPFDYQFVDQEYAKKFESEQQIETLSGVFALLAIFISCLGLFGLAAFVAEQRSKEIGIRKVLGATIFNIWSMVSLEFLALVFVACCAAVPLAYYFLTSWLINYEYRVTISWQVFLWADLAALLITLLTVSFQSLKAAMTNPVKSLRSE